MFKKDFILCVTTISFCLLLTACGRQEQVHEEPVGVVSESVMEIESEPTTIVLQEDYVDTLKEIENGDGIETKETEETEESVEGKESVETVESTESTEVESADTVVATPNGVESISPITKYTNKDCNVRSLPDANSELVNTLPVNTEVTVVGITESGWSQIENNGILCFIKSSLLSDSKIEVSSNVGNETNNTANNATVTSEPANTQERVKSEHEGEWESSNNSSGNDDVTEEELNKIFEELGWGDNSGEAIIGDGLTGMHSDIGGSVE